MINIYVRWILEKKMTLADVPEYWREQVSARLDEESE